MIPIWRYSGRLGNQMFQYAYLYSQARKGIIPDVYLQDEKYFKDVAEEIKYMFGEGLAYIDQVSIHVRRGDYVNNPFYVDLAKTGYYERAMELFPGESFLVFSDDIEWCKEQKMFKDCEFFHGNEVEDMNMMASCKHNIIANSSFSWWAAYLNKNPDKKVVAPLAWHQDGVERTACPSNWIKV